MIDLADYWWQALAVAYASEMALSYYRGYVETKLTIERAQIIGRFALCLKKTVYDICNAHDKTHGFYLRLLRHYQFTRRQGPEWPEEWKQ